MTESDSWWLRFRIWLHMRTHQHVTLVKDDIAEIQSCRRRLQSHVAAAIDFPPSEGLDPVIMKEIGPTSSAFIFSADSALDLRRRALIMGGRGVKR